MSEAVLTFSQSVPASESATQDRRCPHTGFVTRLVAYFGDDADYLVDLRLMLRRRGRAEQLLPSIRDEFFALDNSTLSLDVELPVVEGETLRVQWRNNDGASAHRVPVLVVVDPA